MFMTRRDALHGALRLWALKSARTAGQRHRARGSVLGPSMGSVHSPCHWHVGCTITLNPLKSCSN